VKYSDYPKSSGIYRIVNLSNKKCYVGSGVNIRRRAYEHFSALNANRHYNIHLQRSFNLNKEKFVLEILELCPKETLIEKENEYIDKFQSNKNELGFNMEGAGPTWLGKKHSDASKAKIRAARLRQTISPESRRKALKTLLERYPNHFKDAQKLATRKPRTNHSHWRTEEFRKKIGQIVKNRILKNSKPFMCNETKQIFKSTTDAAKALGIESHKSVWRVLKGLRNHAGGFSFSYVDNLQNSVNLIMTSGQTVDVKF